VGLLFSTVTHNQIVAALLTAAVLLGFWFVGPSAELPGLAGVASLVGYLSFSLHFTDFIQASFAPRASSSTWSSPRSPSP
jgi:hypothetical protein